MSDGFEVMLGVCVFGCSFVRTHVRPSAYNTVYLNILIIFLNKTANSHFNIICWSV